MPRKTPAPFTRPSISIRDTEQKRVWQHISAWRIEVGDIVAEFGLVIYVQPTLAGYYVTWKNRLDETRSLRFDDQVFAFVPIGTLASE